MNDDDIALCRLLRSEGETWESIHALTGYAETTIRRACAKPVIRRPHIAAHPNAFADVAGKIMGGR